MIRMYQPAKKRIPNVAQYTTLRLEHLPKTIGFYRFIGNDANPLLA